MGWCHRAGRHVSAAAAGLGRRALILTGVRSTDWLAAAKEGQLSHDIGKGAGLLLYEQFGPLP